MWVAACGLASCGGVGPATDAPVAGDAPLDPSDGAADGSGDAVVDGGVDAPAPVSCDPTAPFGAPMLVPGLAMTNATELSPRLSPDELTMYFVAKLIGSSTDWDIYVAHRASRGEPFGTATELTVLNSSSFEFDPSVSADGRTIWFHSGRATGEAQHIYFATRASTLAQFGAPQLAAINSSNTAKDDIQPFITADDQELWFDSTRGGAFEIWRAVRAGSGFGAPEVQLVFNSDSTEWAPILSADKRTIYFATDRPGTGTKGTYDIWTSHRSSVDDGFPAPHVVPEVNTDQIDFPGWLSPDNCRLYGTSAEGGDHIWVATRQP